ncbi:sugar phosphate isomerase/epimerase [Niabella pedocola]|uniref:Sugar phosphate isomerase/epimerase n=1 Tax=Niabella pedocola TaxID=1752077 RepID=A0ABS8PPX0_9BACT|nr:sugar phosphate isomerase/epimerase family protein [Niabella pedocola]MCD2422372.1 sugar phosphate isomerase/epimerase [Niabella pedocola]
MDINRKEFLKRTSVLAAGVLAGPSLIAGTGKPKTYPISLAEWSLHRALQKKQITNLDFPRIAKKEFGISIVEYVNQFFKDKAEDTAYLNQLLAVCKDNGVTNHLIMCDGEGELGNTNDAERKKAVENHYKWVHAAKHLGCKTIRVNAAGNGTAEEVAKAAVDGLGRLGEYAAKEKINVIVENHGGYSSDGKWLSGVMKAVGKKTVGTLPDFGNFCLKRGENWKCIEEYDRYLGVKELLPFAKGVSAKSYDFDANGNCIETDYKRIFDIMKTSGFSGIVGIEYEGNELGEYDGIRATLALLKKVMGVS